MSVLLGCIADDFTGATDLANNLVRAGMRVVQAIGVPSGDLDVEVDAVVVALKSRTAPPDRAIADSLAALAWLQERGARQIYFKYCSTFDSTPAGNIGPVTEALMAALRTDFTIATPAFPDNGRTVFKGYLFVGDVLLNESGMQDHPLTPMRDANLVRVLQAQCRRRVGLIDHTVVARGADAVGARIADLRAQGIAIGVVDALSNADLMRLGPALADLALVTAGSGVAIGLPANFGIEPSRGASALPAASGSRAIVAGSCSVATNRQVRAFIDAGGEAFAISADAAARGDDVAQAALDWAGARVGTRPLLVYSTAPPEDVKRTQDCIGAGQAGALFERTLATVARGLVAHGVRQLIVAGGETAGACVQALGVSLLRIGAQIDPGVPWCYAARHSAGGAGLHLALKSGNFGSDDFFTRAFTQLA